MIPPLFISHGAPDLAIIPSKARDFLLGLSKTMPRPRAIVVVSAHFMTRSPAVGADPAPETVYDFGGFDPALRKMTYAAPGDPALAADIAARLEAAGLPARLLPEHGLDHGVWVPLILLYPDADIPVIPLAVQPYMDAAHHFAMGRALAGLGEDVLIVASGAMTHNLQAFFSADSDIDSATAPWVSQFADWTVEKLAAGDAPALLDWQRQAPFARENHPTPEHFLPLFVALGAAGEGAKGERIHTSTHNGVLMMDAFAFA